MAFDGFINKAIVNELIPCIINGKIIKVHQSNKDELILNIYSNGNKFYLNICINSSNCRLHLTSEKKSNPVNPSSFCMLLRKHLIGAKIKSIDTVGFDRLIIFNFEVYNELNDLTSKKLVIELMGKHSNIILLNNNDVIIDSARHISSDRNILPAHPYTLPINNKMNITDITIEDLLTLYNNSSDNFIDFLSYNFYGFSKAYINYIFILLNININNISNTNIINFYNYMINIINCIDSLNVKCIDFNFNNKKDFVLIPSDSQSKLNINFFIDDYYINKEKIEYFKSYRNNMLKILLSILNKYKKRLSNIDNKLDECKNMEKYKLYGELITANLYRLNNNDNLENIILENYYSNNEPINIPLNKKYSLSNNAKIFFKKYNKLKNSLKIVTKQKEITKLELNYIESILYSLNNAKSIDELDDIYLEIQENLFDKKLNKNNTNIKKKEDSSSPITLKSDKYTIYVGRNNKQNDYLTFKIAHKSDLWFHAKDIHGSHVILKINNNENINDDLIKKCASIAAYYSKGKNSSKVPVDYTLVKNIKKPKNSKPGFVTFTNYKTILVEPKEFK